MCLAPSPAHSRHSMCALQNLMKLSSNDFLCKSPAPTPAHSRSAHGHTGGSQGLSPLSLGAGGTLWSLSGGFRRKAGPLATSQALQRPGTVGPSPDWSPSHDGRWSPGGTWLGLGRRSPWGAGTGTWPPDDREGAPGTFVKARNECALGNK